MADLVNLQDRLKAKQVEGAKYLERMDLTAKMIPVRVQTVDKFTSMGASPSHIALLLQATIEEMVRSVARLSRQQLTVIHGHLNFVRESRVAQPLQFVWDGIAGASRAEGEGEMTNRAFLYSKSQSSAAAAARKVCQARISPASDAPAWLRACLAICQCGLF